MMDYTKYVNKKPFPRSPKEWEEGMREEYDAEQTRITVQFWEDIAQEYCIGQDHPKFSALRSKAWEYGHSAGLQEVEYYFADLLDLVL